MERGSVDAALALGNFYRYDSERDGVADLKQAKVWLKKAAELGADTSAELLDIKEQEMQKQQAARASAETAASTPEPVKASELDSSVQQE